MKGQSLKLLVVVTVCLSIAAGCAAPQAPEPTAILPEPTPDSVALIQSWADAIYRGDVDAALSYFTDDGVYLLGYTARGKEDLRWVFNWLAGLETKQENFDCQSGGDKIACAYTVLDGCMAASGSEGLPVTATFTFQDGKIKEAAGNIVSGPEWDGYSEFQSTVMSWESVFRPEESAKARATEFTLEGAPVRIGLCRDYGDAVKTQAPATEAAAHAWVAAINSGDADAAMALFTGETAFAFWTDKSQGQEQVRAMFDWLVGKETLYQITNCEWMGTGVKCDMTAVDGCIAASGVPDGMHGKLTFSSHEDGTLSSVDGVLRVIERRAYQTWLEAEHAWAAAAHAGELVQAEGYSKPAGAMAVKLCREYATAQAAGTSSTTDAQPGSSAAAPIPIIWDDDGSIDGVTALLYLLRNPTFDIKAATVSPGIAHPAVFAPNLARFLTLLRVEGVPVAAGPEQPLAGDNAFPAEWRAASDKFWELELPDAAAPVDERTAAALIVDVIKNSEEPVIVFVSGSLTNLAQALRDDPSIKEGIRSVEIMGGAVKSTGNVGSVPAEWNIYVDPVAAAEVFASGVPIRLTPLDATDQIPWMESDATAWEASGAPASTVAARFLRRTLSDWSSSRILIWDLVAALNVAHPELCQWEDIHLTVAQPGAANAGQTVLVADQAPNVKACLTPDADAYHDAATEVFAVAP